MSYLTRVTSYLSDCNLSPGWHYDQHLRIFVQPDDDQVIPTITMCCKLSAIGNTDFMVNLMTDNDAWLSIFFNMCEGLQYFTQPMKILILFYNSCMIIYYTCLFLLGQERGRQLYFQTLTHHHTTGASRQGAKPIWLK